MGSLGEMKRRIGAKVRGRGGAELPPDLTDAERDTIAAIAPYSMTSPDRVVALTQAVEHIERNSVQGAIVECGVWRGGSMMAVARTLLAGGGATRDLHLFDTYEGMNPPSEADRNHHGESAEELLERSPKGGNDVWCIADLADVTQNMRSTGYPSERVNLVKGPVEETIPDAAPEKIALLRLDTDWYESTRHELEHLYPRLESGGVLIIDDYGHWEGARKAVDEYFGGSLLLARVDYTARIAVKP